MNAARVLIIMQHNMSKKNTTFCLLRIIEIYSTRECRQINYLPTMIV